jgi:hypothetical protein
MPFTATYDELNTPNGKLMVDAKTAGATGKIEIKTGTVGDITMPNGGYLSIEQIPENADGTYPDSQAKLDITHILRNEFVASKALTLPDSNVTAPSAGTTAALATTSTGTGTGATLLITSDGTNITGAVISGVGSGGLYAVGEKIIVSKAAMDADGSIGVTGGDLVITITSGDVVGDIKGKCNIQLSNDGRSILIRVSENVTMSADDNSCIFFTWVSGLTANTARVRGVGIKQFVYT